MKAYYSIPGLTTIYDLSGDGQQAEKLRDMIWRLAEKGSKVLIIAPGEAPYGPCAPTPTTPCRHKLALEVLEQHAIEQQRRIEELQTERDELIDELQDALETNELLNEERDW